MQRESTVKSKFSHWASRHGNLKMTAKRADRTGQGKFIVAPLRNAMLFSGSGVPVTR
jgi:hypothetical protein